MSHVLSNIHRQDLEIVTQLAKFDPATVYEASGQVGMIDPVIHSVWPEAKVCGIALTVECVYGDSLMIHKAVSVAHPGDVLVTNTGGCMHAAVWGDLLTTAAQARNMAGVVIDGAIRDSVAISKSGFPVFCRGFAIRATAKRQLGKINHPISCGGVLVNPRDIVVGNADGIVIVGRERAKDVLARAIKQEERETMIKNRLRKGITTLELLGYDETLRRLGNREN